MNAIHFFLVESVDATEFPITGTLALSIFCNSCGQRQCDYAPMRPAHLLICIGCQGQQTLSEVRFLPSHTIQVPPGALPMQPPTTGNDSSPALPSCNVPEATRSDHANGREHDVSIR